MSRPWFDQQTGVLVIDQYVTEMDSWRQITADRVVTDDELAQQVRRVTALFTDLEAALPPKTRDLATQALCELSVLNALYQQRLNADD